MSSKDARVLLRGAGLSPKKSFGQNFLVSDGVIRAIAEACVRDNEIGHARVVELGAGLGALTSHLLERAKHVVAVERDRDLVPILAAEFAAPIAEGRLTLIEGDAQSVDLESLLGSDGPRVLCGNLPYQITGALIERAVVLAESYERAVFMVQEEVAERIAAPPNSKIYGALTVFVQAACTARKVRSVGAGNFHPAPDVTSAVIELIPRKPRISPEDAVFRSVVKGAFGARRKTLRNAWQSLGLTKEALEELAKEADVSLDARGETLSVNDFARVATLLRKITQSA